MRTKGSGGGCLTCKIRRVKCDRAVPSCNRCVTTGRTCDGRQRPITVVEIKQEAQKVALIRPATQHLLAAPCSDGQVSSLAFPVTDYERHAFSYFQTNVVPGLEQMAPLGNWVPLALQMSTTQPHVYQAMAANAGALKAIVTVHDGVLHRPKDDIAVQSALGQYCRAIASLRQHIGSTDPQLPLDSVLFTSLFLMGFEVNMTGRKSQAMQHRDFSLKLVESDPQLYRLQLAPQARQDLRDFLARGTPAHAEAVTPGRGCQADGTSPPFFEPLLSSQEKCVIEKLLDDLDKLKLRRLQAASEHIEKLKLKNLGSATEYCLGQTIARLSTQALSNSESSTLRRLRETSGELSAVLSNRTSDPDHMSTSPRDLLLIIKLRLAHFLLEMSDCDNELFTDAFLPDLESIFTLCVRYLNETETALTFTLPRPIKARQQEFFVLEHEILPVLNMLVYRCRDRTLRQQALFVLRTCNRREGLEGGIPLASGAGWLADIEDKLAKDSGAKNDHIPEDARCFEAVIMHEPTVLRLFVSRLVRRNDKIVAVDVIEYGAGGPPMPLTPIRSRRFTAQALGLGT